MQREGPGSYQHPTRKPVERCIDNSSWPDQTALDPFVGSGTTIIACERTGRRCLSDREMGAALGAISESEARRKRHNGLARRPATATTLYEVSPHPADAAGTILQDSGPAPIMTLVPDGTPGVGLAEEGS